MQRIPCLFFTPLEVRAVQKVSIVSSLCQSAPSNDSLFSMSHMIYILISVLSKGLVHTTGGYALYAMHTTANSFGLRQQTGPSDPNATHNDVYACVAGTYCCMCGWY